MPIAGVQLDVPALGSKDVPLAYGHLTTPSRCTPGERTGRCGVIVAQGLSPAAREAALEELFSGSELDVLVIGGGVVGCGAALDAVSPDPADLLAVVASRLADIDSELLQIEAERDDKRRRLRADSIADGVTTSDLQRGLIGLSARKTAVDDERRRLQTAVETPPVTAHPHAHLRHRAVPLPTESRDRRRLLRIWATLSTPLLFVILGLFVSSDGPSLVLGTLAGLVVVMGVEALTRGHFRSFAIRVVGGAALVAVGWLLVLGLLANWRMLTIGMLFAAAIVFLVANLRELRRN